ncbi:hypothetical protein PENSTE_c023G09485 [Penicillium steckii]|uniref:BZIP domain-containing protein n=1 Tax=Penicillium steckii TaxID=303698 RepID=A0A1V6SSQ7_9EURO|nr:hypothetical protein PENSTE_c023G09485 [Penicillium steckii]
MARKAATEALRPPALGEDAAERKRVLNVLAQRRYRQKRKERIQALESRAKDSTITPSFPESEFRNDGIISTPISTLNADYLSNIPTAIHQTSRTENEIDPFHESIFDASLFSNVDLQQGQADQSDPNTWKLLGLSEANSIWSCSESFSFDIGTNPIQDLNNFDKQPPHDGNDISEELQAYDTTFFTFPDDKTLEVPSLTLLNAAMRVAQQLRVSDLIWDITAISPFYQGSPPNTSNVSLSPPSLESGLSTIEQSPANPTLQIDLTELPSHLKPTRSQRLIPHHPLLDLLPWPSTRDKLIQVFHLPIHMRPENAQDPMGLVRLVYDMEDDSGEGVTVIGQSPFEPTTWEIGQLVFERWWWAFDTGVIESSNRSRRIRGKEILSIKN